MMEIMELSSLAKGSLALLRGLRISYPDTISRNLYGSLSSSIPFPMPIHPIEDDEPPPRRKWFPGRGVLQDLRRRLPFYKSDFLDGIVDSRSFQKTISSATFLYFIVLPTAIALGMLNEENTKGKISE